MTWKEGTGTSMRYLTAGSSHSLAALRADAQMVDGGPVSRLWGVPEKMEGRLPRCMLKCEFGVRRRNNECAINAVQVFVQYHFVSRRRCEDVLHSCMRCFDKIRRLNGGGTGIGNRDKHDHTISLER